MTHHTHRSRLHHCVVAVGLLTIALLSQTVDASQAASLSDDQREASIRSLLAFCAGPTELQQPIAVTITEERKPWASRSEVEAKLRRYKNRPDHPERGLLRYQLSMFDQPSREIFYSVTPDGDWLLKNYGVRYAQSGSIRWMLSKPEGGQLTIIKAGVPYPSIFEVGQLKPETLRYHRHLFHAGLKDRITDYEINNVNHSATGWSAAISVSDANRSEIALVDGKWVGSSPVISAVRSESGETPVLFEQADFDSHETNSELSPFPYAKSSRSMDYSTSSSVIIVATTVESPSNDEAEALVSVPDPKSAVAVRDFREPRSPSHDLYADAALTTWSRKKGTDMYETSRLASENVYSEESVATARRGFWWAAIALTATVFIAGVFLRARS